MFRAVRLLAVGTTAALALALAACSQPSTDASSSKTAGKNEKLNIAYLGFAKANSFSQAGWAGVQEYAKSHNASATFLDSNFDGPTQVNQLQDVLTSKRYQVVIIQANDGTAMVAPVRQAVAAGLTVVVDFTPIGGRYDTIKAQVPGTINNIDPPTVNGRGLAKLGLQACKKAAASPCKVAYLQGFANYPLDKARTDAAVAALKDGGARVISNLVGGYTQDTGRSAMQNLLQAHPDIDVVIGSSQAIGGAAPLAKDKKIQFVGNGGSKQAFAGVKSGAWYGSYVMPEKAMGAKAAELGLAKARGKKVPTELNACDLTGYQCLGVKKTLAGKTADYSD